MADHAAPHRPDTHQTVQQHLDALIPVINGWHDVPCDLALRALQDAVNGIAARPGGPTAGPPPGPGFPVDPGPGRQGTVPVVTPTPTPDRVTVPPDPTPSPAPSPTPRPSRQEEQKGAPPVQPVQHEAPSPAPQRSPRPAHEPS